LCIYLLPVTTEFQNHFSLIINALYLISTFPSTFYFNQGSIMLSSMYKSFVFSVNKSVLNWTQVY